MIDTDRITNTELKDRLTGLVEEGLAIDKQLEQDILAEIDNTTNEDKRQKLLADRECVNLRIEVLGGLAFSILRSSQWQLTDEIADILVSWTLLTGTVPEFVNGKWTGHFTETLRLSNHTVH